MLLCAYMKLTGRSSFPVQFWVLPCLGKKKKGFVASSIFQIILLYYWQIGQIEEVTHALE